MSNFTSGFKEVVLIVFSMVIAASIALIAIPFLYPDMRLVDRSLIQIGLLLLWAFGLWTGYMAHKIRNNNSASKTSASSKIHTRPHDN